MWDLIVSVPDHCLSFYFKIFDEELFLKDLSEELSRFSFREPDIENDLSLWYNILIKQLDQHAPVKTKRVKTKHMPPWFNPEIAPVRTNMDMNKKRGNWAEYKR